jgi:hypothetical protein
MMTGVSEDFFSLKEEIEELFFESPELLHTYRLL